MSKLTYNSTKFNICIIGLHIFHVAILKYLKYNSYSISIKYKTQVLLC